MSKVEFCVCGSPMSNYEKEHYGKCTACHQKDMEEQARKRQLEEEKRRAEIKAKPNTSLTLVYSFRNPKKAAHHAKGDPS
jgi:hypothetical protein